MCRVKKPWLCVENEGFPLRLFVFLVRADSQTAGRPLALAGLDLPLLILRPGLDQPPPGTGDGLRESDIGFEGVPAARLHTLISQHDLTVFVLVCIRGTRKGSSCMQEVDQVSLHGHVMLEQRNKVS